MAISSSALWKGGPERVDYTADRNNGQALICVKRSLRKQPKQKRVSSLELLTLSDQLALTSSDGDVNAPPGKRMPG